MILDNKSDDKEYIIEESTYHNRYKRWYVKIVKTIDDYNFERENEIKFNSNNIILIW